MDLNKIYSFYNNYLKKRILKIILFSLAFALLILNVINMQFTVKSHYRIQEVSYFNISILLIGISSLYLGMILSKIWNKKFFIKLGVIYGLYLLFSYILDASLRVNEKQFNFFKSLQSSFLQTDFIFYIALIFIFAFVYHYLISVFFPLFEKYLIPISNDREIYTFIFYAFSLTAFCFTDSKFFNAVMGSNFITQFLENNIIKLTIPTLIELDKLILTLVIIVFFISCYIVKGINELENNKPGFGLVVLTSVVFSILLNYFLQYSIRTDVIVMEKHIFPGATLFQISIFFAVFLFLYSIINEYLLTTIINILLIIGISISSYLKYQFRQEPLLPSDLSWLKNPGSLLGFVGSSSYLYVFVLIVFFSLIYWFFKDIFLYGKIFKAQLVRFVTILFILFFFTTVYYSFKNRQDGKMSEHIPVLANLNNRYDIAWFGNTVNAQMKSNSYVWFSQMTSDIMHKPEKYSKTSIKKIEEKYHLKSVEINKYRNQFINEQTVIYVLSESFSDPSRIEKVQVSSNPIPKIQGIKSRTTSGLMKSDGYGGGTANMEFQTLTGLPMYNLSPSISILYTQVAPNMKYFPSISNYFEPKNRDVIHIASPSNYSRNVIYGNLKFNKFIHYGNKGNKGYNVGGNYSDDSTYHLIEENLNKNSQFFSVITMQNHTPWTEPNPIDMNASYPGFSDGQNKSLSSYVRMLSQTDTATQSFLESLSKIDKKITVVFYGDHLPGLYPESAFKNNPESQYQTDYFIWSNFDAPKLNYPLVNSSDFSAMVFEQTNSKVSPYYALLTEVLKKASVDKKALEGEAQEIAEDLKMVEYDLISGKGYLSKDFFKVPTNKSN